MPSPGISGLSVAVLTAGGLLVYAGFRGISPAQALKDVSTGKPAPVASIPAVISTGMGSAPIPGGSGPTGSVAAAAAKYANDKYSQARRTQSGWSDCSSFCDKILEDVGIPPPVKWASTANYRMQTTWKKIALADAQPGDVAVNSHHMVMITGAAGASAIGQQNPRVNVKTGTVSQLIDSFSVYRYKGPSTKVGKSRVPGE
jgi:cell wall-associated NlpC family hydrolase